jgi:colicin import membrane protein
MAGKKFYAATQIKFGKRVENGSAEGKYESKVFKVGDEVTGLTEEDMKGLWAAGALTQTAPEKDEDEDEEAETSSEDEAGKAKAAADAKAKADAAAKAKATAGSRGTSQS